MEPIGMGTVAAGLHQQPERNNNNKWAALNSMDRLSQDQQQQAIKVDSGLEFSLKCSVAANPLAQNTIIQIDWFKDGKRLSSSSPATLNGSILAQQQLNKQAANRIHIERSNHLHMPNQQQQVGPLGGESFQSANTNNKAKQLNTIGNQLVASSKLLAVSSITIKFAQKSDSGIYVCQYKLIPAPGGTTNSIPLNTVAAAATVPIQSNANLMLQQQQQIRITSGQANNTIQVNVVEGNVQKNVKLFL